MSNIKSKALKFIAVFVAFNILLDTIFPTVALALTNGPKSPEFMSFTPVATTNMVDLATGDFNYNLPILEIPGPEGGGYALSLAYNGGVNCEEEASWVGFGWNINPGAIDRNMRGFPDDYEGAEVKYYNKKRPNYTLSKTKRYGIEAFSIDKQTKERKNSIGNIGIDNTVRFNNHYGYYYSNGFSISFKGQGININKDDNGTTFSPQIGLISFKTLMGSERITKWTNNLGSHIKNKYLKNFAKTSFSSAMGKRVGFNAGSILNFQECSKSTTFSEFQGAGMNLSTGLTVNPGNIPIGIQVGKMLHANYQYERYYNPLNAYGFLYNSEDSHAISDYYTEKGNDYKNRDLFIGQPFSNADNFMVSGEGVAGGFRAYKDKVVNYHPNLSSSKMYTYNLGLEFGIGQTFQVGLDIGRGTHKNALHSWGMDQINAENIFRFNGDMGGKIEYGNTNNKILKGNIDLTSKVPGFKKASIDDSEIKNNSLLNKEKSGAVNYVGFKTFGDIVGKPQYSYCKNVNFSESFYKDCYNEKTKSYLLKKSIAEYSITNGNGTNYVYGIPVFVRNETNLSFDVTNKHVDKNRYLAYRSTPLKKVNNNYGITDDALYETGELNHRTIDGEIRNVPYATSYLLSQITTPNYVDVTDNGPSEDDFGGWTKFNYRQVYGSTSDKWYRYRTPYKGLMYSQNSLSDVYDDIGSVNTGEKEVYYLETIETKTHIAFFVTNKYVHNSEKYPEYNIKNDIKSRLDGRDANSPDETHDSFSELNNDKSDNELEYLVKVVLFAKARPDKPLKTINFAYNYSLVPNLPNNYNTSNTLDDSSTLPVENTGKLTLTKVWFEYEGNSPVKISPYEFFYSYFKPSHFETGGELFDEYAKLNDGLGSAQNPAYSPYLLDPWGNIMEYGKERKKYDIDWIYQGINPKYGINVGGWRKEAQATQGFDPAAWHLKCIKLPSGGEIHIQYEQKDYGYVQDRPVMAMASLIAANNSRSEPYYDINVDDLGCNAENEVEVDALLDKINKYLADKKKIENADKLEYLRKVYFKFLFGLVTTAPSLDNTNSEYITGYSEVIDVKKELITINGKNYYTLRFFLGESGSSTGEKTNTPRRGAYDFLSNQRRGIVNGYSPSIGPTAFNFYSLEEDFTKLANKNAKINDNTLSQVKTFFKNLVPTFNDLYSYASTKYEASDVCKNISLSQSFLKLPMLGTKKGGGVRVKRLLIYDSGIEYGAAKIMGQQFHYVLSDGKTSSGVATNEPSGAREENPLVQYLPRKKQRLYSRLTVGEDKTQTEGPVGESLLPISAVYHSRVVVENIHSDKETSGFTIHNFFTTKDYPFDMSFKPKDNISNPDAYDFTGFGSEKTSLEKETDFIPEIALLLFSYRQNSIWISQGFRFVLNSMNGVKKSVASYGGKYMSNGTDDTVSGYLVQLSEYEYYEPGEKVRMVKPNPSGKGFVYEYDIPGKEEEIVVEGKELRDKIFDLNVEFDFGIAWSGFILLSFGICPTISISNEKIATYSTTRVIRYPAILKSESTYTDGVYNKVEYTGFDSNTGQAVITKTYDGYYNPKNLSVEEPQRGVYYNFSVPASWKYLSMGQKFKNVKNSNQLTDQFMTITTYGVEPNPEWFNSKNINNVISANVTTYDNNWDLSWDNPQISKQYGITSDVKAKLASIYRPKESYIYKHPTSVSESKETKVYDRGFFDIEKGIDLSRFESNKNFVKVSEITKYSPNGNPLEELDAMHIPTAVNYGKQYGYNLPVMIAKNAKYGDFYFEDFEGNRDTWSVTADKAHSGENSMIYSDNLNVVSNIFVSDNLYKKGALFKIWISNDFSNLSVPKINVNNKDISLRKVSYTGDWSLFEGIILPQNLSLNSELNISLSGIGSSSYVYIDDVRLQPLDAQATCNVYDPATFKLVAQFDDQHFGIFYKYNGEGVLTHKIVETEKGTQTIEERQYNIPKVDRNEGNN